MKLLILLAGLAALSFVFSAEVTLDNIIARKVWAKPDLSNEDPDSFLALASALTEVDQLRTKLWEDVRALCSSQDHHSFGCAAHTFRSLVGEQGFYSSCKSEAKPRGSKGDNYPTRYAACVYSYFKPLFDAAEAKLATATCTCP